MFNSTLWFRKMFGFIICRVPVIKNDIMNPSLKNGIRKTDFAKMSKVMYPL